MQAYTAYCENGHIIPVGNPVIPEGRKLIITVLDEFAAITKVRVSSEISDIALVSEQSLAKVWLSQEEDEAWADL
jgi:hypothetical protein